MAARDGATMSENTPFACMHIATPHHKPQNKKGTAVDAVDVSCGDCLRRCTQDVHGL